MQLFYGAFGFPFNGVDIAADVKILWNQGGQPFKQVRSLQVSGYFSVLGQVDAALQESAMRTALSVPFQNLIFLNDLGAQTPTQLLNAGSSTGVRITDLAFPTTKGAEYATLRNFRFTASAEYPVLNAASLLLSFTETLTFSGGGPIYKHRLALNGPPQKQMVYTQDSFKAVQHGSSSGYTATPFAPDPIWPYALRESPNITRTSPTRKGFGYEGYGLTWTYNFEDAGPLEGLPTLWTN